MPASDNDINTIFEKGMSGDILSINEIEKYQYAVISFCAEEYARLGWVMQLHLGVMRDTNSIMFDKLGADTGFDCVDTANGMTGLAQFLNELNSTNSLPKTLVFSIDPSDNIRVNSLAMCFSREGMKSVVQQGSAWWYNDTYTGIERQIVDFAEGCVLANFVGMLTDSRSFLSYTRHEYFRRILCNIFGKWVDCGLYPDDKEYLGSIIQDICYNNAKSFFNQ